MRLQLNASNPSSGTAPSDYTKYGEVAYGSTTYNISGYYQSAYLPPRTVGYVLSGKVYFSYRLESGGVWSTWHDSTTSGNITALEQWQYRIVFTGNWDSGDYVEVL